MRFKLIWLLFLLDLSLYPAHAQGTVPTFERSAGQNSYTLAGRDPVEGGTTTIPTVLVPITLSFAAREPTGDPFVMAAAADVPRLLRSPIFSRFAFAPGNATQYADAMLRSTFPKAEGWHTLLGRPEVKPVRIVVPAGYGYILNSKREGGSFAVVDIEFLQREIFKQIPRQEGKLVVALTHNTTYYTESDATLCCSWGTHGIDSATGNSFVLGSYLGGAPHVVEESDVQPLTQQLAEFINDPLHDPLFHGRNVPVPGNSFAGWLRPVSHRLGEQSGCGGTHVATAYFLLEPTDINPKNNFPVSKAFVAHAGGARYHLQNVALLPWYVGVSGDLGNTYSFPDSQVLSAPAERCTPTSVVSAPVSSVSPEPLVAEVPPGGSPTRHRMIGYWTGTFPLHEVSPQWDVILVAFAEPDRNAPEGTLRFQLRAGLNPEEFKADIARLKGQGKRVMISLGGGGKIFTLDDPASIPGLVSSVTQIVSEYGFDGIDLDFESPSLNIDAGDTDFKHPTTPSIVNLISALRQLHNRFGPGFMISLVPEGTQIPAGALSYGGQFGSYLAITYAIRDILSFVDVQDYNTPPLEGLDGEIYQSSSVDYHAAMTELLLHGFNVGGDAKQFFPPLAASKVAVGFLAGYTSPTIVSQAMGEIISGKAPTGTRYRLRKPAGYPDMIGAMLWTIDADRRDHYDFSNVVGPLLHSSVGTNHIGEKRGR
jgi:chitinase